MSALPPPPPDASPTRRGLVNKKEQSFKGPKRFIDDTQVDATLTVGADWETEVDGDDGTIVLRGLPLQLGGFTADLDLSTPGCHHYELELPGGGPPIERFIFGFEQLQFDWDVDADRVGLNGDFQANNLFASHIEVGSLDADEILVGGVPLTGGVEEVGSVGTAPNGAGATVSGTTLTLQPADGTHPGVLTALAQLIAGAKTFLTNLIVQGAITFRRSLVDDGVSGFPTQLIGTNQGFLVDTIAAVSAVAKLFSFRTFGDYVSWVTGRGTYGVVGTMGDTVGSQTINAAKGRARIAAGESDITITNDQVTTTSVVTIEWEEAPCEQSDNKLAMFTVIPVAGAFTVAIWREFDTPAAARSDHAFRFLVTQ